MAKLPRKRPARKAANAAVESHEGLHLIRLFPNMVTLLALCAGLSSIRFALNERFEIAVAYIIAAALLDAVDGRLARMLNASSPFGAQLDSLADFVNFGVAPAMVIYLWGLDGHGAIGWGFVLFFAICAAIRLARFNSDLDDGKSKPDWQVHFFTGVPSPAGAISLLYPLILLFTFKQEWPELYESIDFTAHPWFLRGYMAFVALMMASRVPTLSLKKIRVPRRYVSLVLVLVAAVLIMFVSAPWLTMTCVGVVYMTSLPLGLILYARFNRQS